MSIEEFLWAKNDTITASAIRDAYEKRKALGDAIHRKVMQIFRTYIVVGGMPQAVKAFVEGKTYQEIDFVKRNILSLYEDDLKKYDEENKEKASVIFKTIPEQLSNHNSHFKFSLVGKNARYKHYVDAVNFVAESMMGNECINITAPEVSMEAYADRSNFKLYMGDTGLLITQIMKNSDETDFLIVKKRKICPLEVKSSSYKSHRSLDLFVEKYPIKVEERCVIYTKDVQYAEGVLYIPLYMTMCI